MEETTYARPYAAAAFDFASKYNEQEKWSFFLHSAAHISSTAKAKLIICSPRKTTNEKVEIFDRVLDNLSRSELNFLKQLSDHGRLVLLPTIADLYHVLWYEKEKKAQVSVITPFSLTLEQRKKLSQKLNKRFNREIFINEVLDKSIIGGLIVKYQDQVIDGSIRSKLLALAKSI